MDRKNLLADQLEFYQDLGVTHLNLTLPSLESLESGIADCSRCGFSINRKGVIAGWGSPQADLMFAVDAPSEESLKSGEPLAGEARDLLHKIIRAIDVDPADVFITNGVKCCAGDKRKPAASEIETCRFWLLSQINIIDPLVIVPLGNVAAQGILSTTETISTLRGRIHYLGKYPVMPTFHPEYLLHNPRAKSDVWHDMKMVRGRLKKKS
ncbi:MAG: uracil-DNA glycosylase [Acidobacteriota bacterium]